MYKLFSFGRYLCFQTGRGRASAININIKSIHRQRKPLNSRPAQTGHSFFDLLFLYIHTYEYTTADSKIPPAVTEQAEAQQPEANYCKRYTYCYKYYFV